MPADVDLFDMLQPNVLQAMTNEQLLHELWRALQMQIRVTGYTAKILDILEAKAALPHQKSAASPGTGGCDPAR